MRFTTNLGSAILLCMIGQTAQSVIAEEKAEKVIPVTRIAPGIFQDLTPPEMDLPKAAPEAAHASKHVGGASIKSHEEDSKWMTSAELLILKTRMPTLGYALIDTRDDLIPSGNVSTLQYDVRGGLRVQAHRKLGESKIYLGLTYTYFHSVSREVATAPPDGLVYPLFTRPGLTDIVQTVTNQARLNYNVFDIDASRKFELDEFVDLQLQTGVRIASILHTANLGYNGILADRASSTVRSNFEGAGPTVGIESTMRPGHGIGIFTRVQGGLIQGNIRSSLLETNNAGNTAYANIGNRSQQLVPFTQVGIGLGWQSKRITIRVGYELTNWFGLIQYPQLTDDFAEGKVIPRSSDLVLQGLFFQLGTEF
jgi:hypothetical protein